MHDEIYDLRTLQTFVWGGLDHNTDQKTVNALILDPDRKIIRSDLHEQEEVEFELQDGFAGIRVLQGDLLPNPVDQHGQGQWMRQREFVAGQQRYELIHQVIISDRDLSRLKESDFGDKFDITLKSTSPGMVWYESESTLIEFVTESQIRESRLGKG